VTSTKGVPTQWSQVHYRRVMSSRRSDAKSHHVTTPTIDFTQHGRSGRPFYRPAIDKALYSTVKLARTARRQAARPDPL
jgi:hypothetical protein